MLHQTYFNSLTHGKEDIGRIRFAATVKTFAVVRSSAILPVVSEDQLWRGTLWIDGRSVLG